MIDCELMTSGVAMPSSLGPSPARSTLEPLFDKSETRTPSVSNPLARAAISNRSNKVPAGKVNLSASLIDARSPIASVSVPAKS